MMEKKPPQNIDEYIAGFPEDVQEKLNKMRATIRQAAPQAREKISYQMPTFFLEGNLVHFAAYKNHIGFYPTPSGIERFKELLSAYRVPRVRSNSHWTSRSPTNWSVKSLPFESRRTWQKQPQNVKRESDRLQI